MIFFNELKVDGAKKGNVLKTAKAVIAWVIKHCNPHWIPPVDGPSGGQISDALKVVKLQVYKECSCHVSL